MAEAAGRIVAAVTLTFARYTGFGPVLWLLRSTLTLLPLRSRSVTKAYSSCLTGLI